MSSDQPKKVTLDEADQFRNLILFAACTGLQYLAAPVLYVGITQSGLLEKLNASTQVSNLPSTFFFAFTAMPAVLAWLFPRVRQLKPMLAVCYGANALVMLLVAIALASDLPNWIMILLIVIQGAIIGATIPTAIALLWEIVGRGAEESKRGLALGLAFGGGPVLAVIGSLVQTALLGGFVFWQMPGVDNGYAWLFGLGAPCIGLAAILSCFFVLPDEEKEPEIESFFSVIDLLGGLALAGIGMALFLVGSDWMEGNENGKFAIQLAGYGCLAAATVLVGIHFRDILSNRLLLIATIVTVLVYVGNTIPSNMSLYSTEALEAAPQKYAGVQNALRFGFKMIAGAFLGWMLTQSHPKAGLLMTAGIFVVAQLWAITFVGPRYLIAFGIYGAGELIGVYAPNYMLSATSKPKIRRTMALATMLMVPAAPFGFLFGGIVDTFKEDFGASFAFRLSFALCAAIMVLGIMIAALFLPKDPSQGEVRK